jgi:hypothetical protein
MPNVKFATETLGYKTKNNMHSLKEKEPPPENIGGNTTKGGKP